MKKNTGKHYFETEIDSKGDAILIGIAE